MKKTLFFLAVLLVLHVSTLQVSAQLIIRNSGHAEIGQNPSAATDTDAVTVLKIFGDYGDHAAGGHISFGDSLNVVIGEKGITDTDRLWMHGKNGVYLTAHFTSNTEDTIMYFDPSLSTTLNFGADVTAHGVLIQSDEHFKEDVEPVEGVLNSLENLEAVTYKLKSHRCANAMSASMYAKDIKERAAMEKYAKNLESGSERYGFLAQNVKEVFPQLVHTDNSGYMYVDYIGLIPILVQSINELRAELAELKGEQLDDDDIAPLRQAMQASQNEIEASLNTPKLYQNAPNPWSNETVIRYSLPQEVANACIYIYDMQGTQLKSIAAQGRGESHVTLTAHDLKAGMYIYALVADGQLVDSKQMILTK